MTYFNINYNALKDYILNQKDMYNSIDIMCLLDMGIINQQQYEDLCTIVTKPIYDYKNFYQQNTGYYRQQGPLTLNQNLKSITAKSRLKKLQ